MQVIESMPNKIQYGLTGIPEVMQNVRMILTTRRGTCPLDRNFGISFDFLDSPINETRARAEQELFLQIKKYEPRAVIKQIIWEADILTGNIQPKVSVEVNLDVI